MRTTLALVAGAIVVCLFAVIMSNKIPQAEYTTNAHDRAEAAKLKARLAESSNNNQKHDGDTKEFKPVDTVQIASGKHKYVLISAREPKSDEHTYFVTSRRGASYHRNAAEPLVHSLENAGYQQIEIEGGGRILLDEKDKKISVFGFSYSFGQANHEISKRVVQADGRFKDFAITVSNEGY